MMQKKKFKPVITRIKLNPEQAVLQCSCYTGWVWTTLKQTFGYSNATPGGGSFCAEWGKYSQKYMFTLGGVGTSTTPQNFLWYKQSISSS